MTKIIRISTYNPILSNDNKKLLLKNPFAKYKFELQKLVNELLYEEKVPALLSKDVTSNVDFPARLSQVLAKQASSIVRSIQSKIKLANKAKNKQKYQQEILQKYNNRSIEIDITNFNIELDSRFISIEPNKNTTICDYWIKITSFPKSNFYIPVKFTNHMKKLISRGFNLKTNSLRINSNGSIGLYFRKELQLKTGTKSLGVDIGRNKVVAASDGSIETTHKTGLKIKPLLDLIKLRKSRSKQSRKTRIQIKQQINYSLKHDINWCNIDQLIIENLTNIKANNRWGKKSHHWTIGYISNKIKQLSEENDVRLTQVNAAFTSQICSKCEFKHKGNRIHEKFLCLNCGYQTDADINASINIHNRAVNSRSVIKIYNHI